MFIFSITYVCSVSREPFCFKSVIPRHHQRSEIELHCRWETRESPWVLSRILLMHLKGAFLNLFESMNHLFNVEEPQQHKDAGRKSKPHPLIIVYIFSMYHVIIITHTFTPQHPLFIFFLFSMFINVNYHHAHIHSKIAFPLPTTCIYFK